MESTPFFLRIRCSGSIWGNGEGVRGKGGIWVCVCVVCVCVLHRLVYTGAHASSACIRPSVKQPMGVGASASVIGPPPR